MKIGLLLFKNVIGGVETVNLELANMLMSKGHDVFLLFPGLSNTEEKMPFPENFKIHEISGQDGSVKKAVDYIAEVMNLESPDLIISNFIEESHLLIKAKKYIKKDFRIIMINHMGCFNQYKKFWSDRIIEIYNQSKCLVTITKIDELFYKDKINVPVVTIPNMPREEFYSEINSFENNARNKKILALGRFVDIKGFDILIKAFSKANSLDWTLHIYGYGPEKDNLDNLINQLNMNDKIFLHPSTKEVAKTMNEHEFFVLPSILEPYGMVLLESLLMGLPCISFDCPNGPAVIEAEVPGSVVLVPNKDEIALANAIENLIHNEAKRKELSALALSYRKLINKEKNIDAWNKLLIEN